MARNYLNYNGQVSQPFTVMAAFIKDRANYRFEFDTWRSTTDFNSEADPYPPLHRGVIADASFATTNATLLGQLGTAMLNEMGLGGRQYTLEGVVWMPVSRVLTMIAVKGDNRVTMIKQAGDYSAFVTANLTAFQNLNAAVWAQAKAQDPFFERMTAAT